MKQSELQKRLGELERRIKELEQREPAVGYPSAATVPYWQSVPYWVYVTNATGTDPMLTTSTTTL